jgi:hypothetical protein
MANVILACLMFAAGGIGFGGSPWPGFAIGSLLVIAFGLPAQRDQLRRYAGQPKTDIVFVILFETGGAIVGILGSAWTGYLLRLLAAASR